MHHIFFFLNIIFKIINFHFKGLKLLSNVEKKMKKELILPHF